jgi:hypothetical protein
MVRRRRGGSLWWSRSSPTDLDTAWVALSIPTAIPRDRGAPCFLAETPSHVGLQNRKPAQLLGPGAISATASAPATAGNAGPLGASGSHGPSVATEILTDAGEGGGPIRFVDLAAYYPGVPSRDLVSYAACRSSGRSSSGSAISKPSLRRAVTSVRNFSRLCAAYAEGSPASSAMRTAWYLAYQAPAARSASSSSGARSSVVSLSMCRTLALASDVSLARGGVASLVAGF